MARLECRSVPAPRRLAHPLMFTLKGWAGQTASHLPPCFCPRDDDSSHAFGVRSLGVSSALNCHSDEEPGALGGDVSRPNLPVSGELKLDKKPVLRISGKGLQLLFQVPSQNVLLKSHTWCGVLSGSPHPESAWGHPWSSAELALGKGAQIPSSTACLPCPAFHPILGWNEVLSHALCSTCCAWGGPTHTGTFVSPTGFSLLNKIPFCL